MSEQLKTQFPSRFLAKVAVQESGCWQWTGATRSNPKYPEHKYGLFSSDGSAKGVMSAHCYAYRAVKGAIPAGLEIDHSCHNKLCVNPEHLEAVTHQQNCVRRPRSGPLPKRDEFLRTQGVQI